MKIKNWDIWQSYRKDRGQPPWIKVHRCLLRNPEWVQLSDAEKGQLISMWMLAADKDGEIPNDPSMIQKLCFLDKIPNINKFIDLSFIAADGCQRDANVTASGCQRDAPDKIRVDKIRVDKSRKNIVRQVEPEEGFDAFWNLYPKKQGKGACKKIWKKMKVSGELLNIVLAAVEKQKQSKQWTKENGQFIPMPATWLNQERWDDEITENGFAGQDRYLNAMITEEDLNGSK